VRVGVKWNHVAKRIPRDDALRFFRVGRTQVRDLRRLKLRQLGFPAQDPTKKKLKHRRGKGEEMECPYILSDSRCRIGGVELCKSLDVF
jgi:hypothetical protein